METESAFYISLSSFILWPVGFPLFPSLSIYIFSSFLSLPLVNLFSLEAYSVLLHFSLCLLSKLFN